jgi:DNA replication protein DnaC
MVIDYHSIDAENFPASEWVSSSGYLTTTPLPYCGECQEGIVYEKPPPPSAPIARRCPLCTPLRDRLKRLEDARLPFLAHQHTLSSYEWDSPKQRERVGAILDWIHGKTDPIDKPAVMLYGKPGNGKSMILHILAKHAIFQGKRALFISHEALFADIRSSWSSKTINLHEMLEKVDLLCLDELGGLGGGGRWSDWYKSQTREMIGAIYDRWASKTLSVILTSNLTPQTITQDLCDRNSAVRSRLSAIFGAPVQMVGRDRRAGTDDGWG